MGSVAGGGVLDQKTAVIIPQDQQQQEQQQQQQKQEMLRCPRCDSSNTKFCYYNNYSLSQPRHFCKACKRYWTRGGTLRNVPVGGGCRKNKRLKRPSIINISSNPSSSSTNSSLTNSINLDHAANSVPAGANIHDHHHHHVVNPLLYHHDNHLNFPFSRYDLQHPPQIHSLRLGFSSVNHNNNTGDLGYPNHDPESKQIFQELISSNPLLSNYTNTTSTTTASCSSSSPSISSLLASTLQIKGGNNYHQALLLPNSYHQEDHNDNNFQMKDVKMELEGQNTSNIMHHWSISNTNTNANANATPNHQNHMDHQTINSSDPSLLWGTGSAWLDPSNNLGSSVSSLI